MGPKGSAALISISLALSGHQPKLRHHGYGASASRALYDRLLPRFRWYFFNRPRRDGTLSWRLCTVAAGELRTRDLAISSLILYHTATSCMLVAFFVTDAVRCHD